MYLTTPLKHTNDNSFNLKFIMTVRSQSKAKSKKHTHLLVALALFVICSLILGAPSVWANQEYQYSRIAGTRDLEKLDLDCNSEFIDSTFYQSECSGWLNLNDSLGSFPDLDLPIPGGSQEWVDDYWEDVYEPHPWIWRDLADTENQHLLHGGSRQIIHGERWIGPTLYEEEIDYEEENYGDDDWTYWTLQFATGPLRIESEGDGWDYTSIENTGEEYDIEIREAGFGGGYEPWFYAGPFSEDVVCENIVDYVPKRFVISVTTTDEQTSEQEERAVVEIIADVYEEEYVTYCFEVRYTLGSEQTGWIKVIVPLEEFWQQIENRFDEIEDDIEPPLGFSADDSDTSSPDPERILEEIFKTIPGYTTLFVKTFKDQSAKEAYFVANIEEHPCSISPTFVLDSDLSVIYYLPEDGSSNETIVTETETILTNHAATAKTVLSEISLGLASLEENSDEIEIYELKPCTDLIDDLEKKALDCQISGRTTGICSGGTDKDLLDEIGAVAESCQNMYDNVDENNPPEPSDLADCLQLTDAVRQDFIDAIQIIDKNDRNYIEVYDYIGYYRSDTDLPYVLWDEWTELTVDKIRFQFELVALHEYMHKLYSRDLSLKERMRFHREVLALYENEEKVFFDYLGSGNLGDEIKHRINRHDNAWEGLVEADMLIEQVNGFAPQLIAALPEDIQEEYAEFINDRYGLVAFVYALAETQLYTLYEEESGIEPENIILGVDDFIKENRLEQISSEYFASISDEDNPDAPSEALMHVLARIPLSIRYKDDSSFYGFNFDELDIDALERLRERSTEISEEISELERELLDQFYGKLKDKLVEEYGNSYGRVIAVTAGVMTESFQFLLSVNPNLGTDDAFMDQIIDKIKSKMDEISEEELTEWEQSILDRTYDYEFNYKIIDISSLIETEFDGIDEYLMNNVFVNFSGFFAESYPILALETPARLSNWLEEHYNQYTNRSALSRYFKYYPQLEFNSLTETES